MQLQGPDAHIADVCDEIIRLLTTTGLVIHDIRTPPEDNGEPSDYLLDECIRVDWLPKLAAQLVRAGYLWSVCSDAVCKEDADQQNKLHSQSPYLGNLVVAAHSSAMCGDKDTMTDPMEKML